MQKVVSRLHGLTKNHVISSTMGRYYSCLVLPVNVIVDRGRSPLWLNRRKGEGVFKSFVLASPEKHEDVRTVRVAVTGNLKYAASGTFDHVTSVVFPSSSTHLTSTSPPTFPHPPSLPHGRNLSQHSQVPLITSDPFG